MSGLPEMTGGVDLEELKDGYISVVITKDMYCNYKGLCKVDKVLSNGLCLYCVHRVGINIPNLIDSKIYEKKKEIEERIRKERELKVNG